MFMLFDIPGVHLSVQRQLWTQPQLRAVSRRRRASRRRRLSAVLAPPHGLREDPPRVKAVGPCL
jgi:hypothetical protein